MRSANIGALDLCAKPNAKFLDSPVTPSSPSSQYSKSSLAGITDTLCPYRGVVLSFWDNILGPRVRHIWKTDNKERLNTELLSHITSQVLSSEICRDLHKCDIDFKFYNLPQKNVIVPAFVFSAKGENGQSVHTLFLVLSQSDLEFYLDIHDVLANCMTRLAGKLRILLEKNTFNDSLDVFSKCLFKCLRHLSHIHTASLENNVKFHDTAFCPDHVLEKDFLTRCVASHLMTFGRSLVLGETAERINLLLFTLSMFNSASERRCSLPLCVKNPQTSYHHDLYLQGLIKSKHRPELPMTEIVASQYPTTIIDLSSRVVRQTQCYSEHVLHRYETIKNELICLQYGHFEDLEVLDQDLTSVSAYPETMVQKLVKEIFELPGMCSIRENYIVHFMRLLNKKAQCLIEWTRAESLEWSTSIKPQTLKKIRQDLKLNAEGDFRIVLSAAEKLKPGIYCFLKRPRAERDHIKAEVL